jgi:uncharacterized protein YfaS (alpha-2-macroglobulin family)
LFGCTTANITSNNTPLPAVSPVPNATLPDWIEEISPIGEAVTTAQIRIRFQAPLIPIEHLESVDRQALLQKFAVVPPLPGQFRFLTPRMVGFQADQAIPKATRVQVRLKAGLADLQGHRLNQDFVWTFSTEPIKFTDANEPDAAGQADDLKPVLTLEANTELELASLQQHLKLVSPNQSIVPLKLTLQDDATANSPEARFDPAARSWIYTIEPQRSLEKATRYRLEVAPGVQPARGNLPSEAKFVREIVTYAPLAFRQMLLVGQPDAGEADSRFVKGMAQLEFNNGLDAASAIANIQVQPAPKADVPLVRAYDTETLVSLNPWALEPATTYKVTIGANLKDRYGQTLGKPLTLTYATGDVAPDLWAPSGLNIFPIGKNLQLNLSTVNLSSYKSAFAVVQPTDLVYTDATALQDNGSGLLPDPANWKQVAISLKKNRSVEVAIPLRRELGSPTGMLAYGVQARTHTYLEDKQEKWREPTFSGMVQLTNLGVFAQWFPQSGFVRVHHLSNGSAVANATIEVYLSKLDAKLRLAPSPCATGKTDRTGVLLLNQSALEKCFDTETGFATAPNLLVIAREDTDWAFTRTLDYSGSYEYGVYAGWQGTKPEARGVIFSDRAFYRPGEQAWFTGVAAYLRSGDLKLDKRTAYALTLKDPNGQVTDLGTQVTNAYGTFAVDWTIGTTQPIGNYIIRAKNEAGVELTGEFRVAEFKPPNFQVKLALDAETTPAIVTMGQTVTAKTQSNYLFGSPVEGGMAQYYVTRQQTEFTPPGWDSFTFGQRWFYPEEAPSLPTDVLQTSHRLDRNGQTSQAIAVAKDLPYPMRYRVDAEVKDPSNLAVADSQTFLALPSDRLIGLKTDFVAAGGNPLSVSLIVTNPQGQPLPNERVRVELQQMVYGRATRLVEGSRTTQSQVEYKTVATTEIQSGQQAVAVTLTPPAAGSYRLRALFAGASSEANATDQQVWATGSGMVGWSDRHDRLEIQLDKSSYRPGDLATALIQSPYPEGELYFAVVRDRPLYRTVTRVKGGAPQIQFRVTADMVPNAAVEAILVRQGKPVAQLEAGSLDHLTRIGFAPFTTDLSDRYLKLNASVTPTLPPGAEQTVQVALKNAQDQPVQGQVTVMVVNEAILQLSGYRPPDLVKTVYAEQPISVRLSDNRQHVVLQPQASPVDKGWGFGGGLSLGAGSTRVRTDFRAIAYYNGSVLTDAAGAATVRFKLPDDLTTWRVLLVATDGNLRFGNGETTFVSTQPLIASPLVPQFARPGDRLQLGVAVTNNTGQTGSLRVKSAVTAPLKLESSGDRQTSIAAGTQAYRFPVTAQAPGEAKLQVTTQLNQASDAFEVPLPVPPLAVTEQVVEAGSTARSLSIPLKLDAAAVPEVGGLEIALASTALPTLTAPVQQILATAELPFLEPAASQLAIAANLQRLQQRGQPIVEFDAAAHAAQAIERLRPLQQPDGGFAALPGQTRSDPFMTAYAAQSLAQVRPVFTGLDVTAMTPPLQAYLSQVLADPGQYEFCQTPLCKRQVRLEALIGLAALGDRRNDFLSELYEQRQEFDLGSQLKLARYLLQTPGWQSEGGRLANQLQQAFSETGRNLTVNLPPDWRWLNSPTAAQAAALQLRVAQKARSEELAKLAQSLLALRRNGVWPNTHDSAIALTALADYSQLQPPPTRMTVQAQLGGQTVGSASFDGQRHASTIQVPIAQWPKAGGRQELRLQKSGQGLLHYEITQRYRLQGNPPGRLNGLRISRTIRPANQEKVLYRVGLYAPEPLKLPVGQVYDIGLEVITDRPVDHVIITDPLPAGFEPIDQRFQTTTPYFQAQGDSWQLGFQTLLRDRVLAYGDRLNPGVYTLHYLVRSVTPGTFVYPGAEAHLQFATEEFGRSAATTIELTE